MTRKPLYAIFVVLSILSIVVLSACGDKSSTSPTTPKPTALTVTLSVQHISQRTLSDGAINCTVTGGKAPYTFAWSNAAVTEDITNLTAGTYTVIVTDADNVSVTKNKTVIEPQQFTDVDGNVYETIILGNQQWFASNAKMLKTPSGTAITAGTNVLGGSTDARYYILTQTGSTTVEENPVFYNWPAAQAVCPSGWRVATEADWTQLLNYLAVNNQGGTGSIAADKMKSTASSSGFDALFTGYWDAGSFFVSGNSTIFWSSTQYPNDSRDNWVYRLTTSSTIDKLYFDKRCAYSVRFVKTIEN